MLYRLFNRRLNSSMRFLKYSMTTQSQSNFDLASKLKLLNDSKQYQKALELFDNYKENDAKNLSNLSVIQALKACALTRDLRRGSNIHRLFASRVNNDFYLLTSLIHLYSKS